MSRLLMRVIIWFWCQFAGLFSHVTTPYVGVIKSCKILLGPLMNDTDQHAVGI